jgi:hypothetical protein
MNGHIYLRIALGFAAIGLVLWVIGPIADRWHKRLEMDLQRMKQKK